MIGQIVEYNDPNVEIIQPSNSVENTKQKHNKREASGMKKEKIGSSRLNTPSNSRKLRSDLC